MRFSLADEEVAGRRNERGKIGDPSRSPKMAAATARYQTNSGDQSKTKKNQPKKKHRQKKKHQHKKKHKTKGHGNKTAGHGRGGSK